MKIAMSQSHSETRSQDGTLIRYLSVGAGPGLIVVPGALKTAADYAELARALAGRFTVHVVERRGRGGSGPQGPDYGIHRECQDLAAVRAATCADFIFGHSYGGLVVLEAALTMAGRPPKGIVVYEPGVSIRGSIPVDWIPEYREHLQADKRLDAFITFIRALGPDAARVAPRWWMKFIMGFVLRGAERDKTLGLLPENLREHAEVGRLDNAYPRYGGIETAASFLVGGKSGRSARQTAEVLAEVVPHGMIQVLPGLDHFGPDQGDPGRVAEAVILAFAPDAAVE